MAIKNLFGRGIGFGGSEWIPTRGFSLQEEAPVEEIAPSQTNVAAGRVLQFVSGARSLSWQAPRRSDG